MSVQDVFEGLDNKVAETGTPAPGAGEEPSSKKARTEAVESAEVGEEILTVAALGKKMKTPAQLLSALMEELGGDVNSDLGDFACTLEADINAALDTIEQEGKKLKPLQKGSARKCWMEAVAIHQGKYAKPAEANNLP